jgi:YVTN family beta-propeller protein
LRINPPFSVSYQVTENNPQHGFVTGILPLPAGSAPFGIAFNPNNGNMYMTNFNSDSVSVVNPSTNTVISTIPVGSAPFGIAFNPNNGNMYVTDAGGKTISVIAPLTTTYSGGCNGTIDAGQTSAICNINTTYGK